MLRKGLLDVFKAASEAYAKHTDGLGPYHVMDEGFGRASDGEWVSGPVDSFKAWASATLFEALAVRSKWAALGNWHQSHQTSDTVVVGQPAAIRHDLELRTPLLSWGEMWQVLKTHVTAAAPAPAPAPAPGPGPSDGGGSDDDDDQDVDDDHDEWWWWW